MQNKTNERPSRWHVWGVRTAGKFFLTLNWNLKFSFAAFQRGMRLTSCQVTEKWWDTELAPVITCLM